MTLTVRRINDLRRTINEREVTWLARVPGDYEYATHKGVEYQVARQPVGDPADFAHQPGEILIRRVTVEDVDGSKLEHHRLCRALPIESGTHAKLAAQAAKRPAAKPMRTWSVLSGLFSARRDPYRIRTGPGASDPTFGALKAAIGTKEPKPWIEVAPNLAPEPGAAAVIARLARHGHKLRLGRGNLVRESRTPISFEDRQLLKRAAPLVKAYLAGKSVLCSDCSEPAIDIVDVDAPMCAEHAGPRR